MKLKSLRIERKLFSKNGQDFKATLCIDDETKKIELEISKERTAALINFAAQELIAASEDGAKEFRKDLEKITSKY